MKNNEKILSIKDLSLKVSKHILFNPISFNLFQNDFLSILGKNGVGKTTLIKAILFNQKINSGQIKLYIKDNLIGYVPQFRNLPKDYPLTVKEFISLAFDKSLLPWLSKKEKKRLNVVLQQTRLLDLANYRMSNLSGGELERAYLAQALLNNPKLLILDESTASLDNISKLNLLELVKSYQKEAKISVIFATHDLSLAKKYSDHYLLIEPDRYSYGNINELSDQQLEDANA